MAVIYCLKTLAAMTKYMQSNLPHTRMLLVNCIQTDLSETYCFWIRSIPHKSHCKVCWKVNDSRLPGGAMILGQWQHNSRMINDTRHTR